MNILLCSWPTTAPWSCAIDNYLVFSSFSEQILAASFGFWFVSWVGLIFGLDSLCTELSSWNFWGIWRYGFEKKTSWSCLSDGFFIMLSRWEPVVLMSSLSRNGDIGLEPPWLWSYGIKSICLTPELDAIFGEHICTGYTLKAFTCLYSDLWGF